MSVIITIGGIDITKYVVWESLKIRNILTTKNDTCDFKIRNYGDKYFVPAVGREVIITDGGVRVFAGNIVRRTHQFKPYKIIEYACECVDYTRQLSKKLVSKIYENMTVTAIIQDLVSVYAPAGFTTANVSCDISIEYVTFNYQQLDKCIQQLADLTNYDWYVDYNKDIWFKSALTNSAPFQITETNGNCNLNSLTIRKDNSQIKNSIVVRGGEFEAASYTAEINCNGVDYVYSLPYKFNEFAATLTGISLNIGIDFSSDPDQHDALYNKNEKIIRFKTSDTPSNGSLLVVSGLPILPLILKVKSPTDISAMYSMEGVAGDYEYLIIDATIQSRQAARDLAQAKLYAYARTLTEGDFITEVAGLKAGQIININVPTLEVNDDYIINKVESEMFDTTSMRYKVSLITTKTMDMIAVLQQLLSQKTNIKINEKEVLDLVELVLEYISFVENVSYTTIHNPQTESATISEDFDNTGLNFNIQFVAGPATPSNTEITEDSYSQTNYTGGQYINGAGYLASGQSFTASANGVLNSCKFYLAKGGTGGLPTGNAVAKLYSHSGTYGTSSVPNTLLATSDNFDVSTLTGSYALTTFNFSSGSSLSAGTYYCITFEYSGGDANNVIRVGYDSTSPTHSGNLVRKSNAGVWGALSGYDTVFYVYGLSAGKRIFICDGSHLG